MGGGFQDHIKNKENNHAIQVNHFELFEHKTALFEVNKVNSA